MISVLRNGRDRFVDRLRSWLSMAEVRHQQAEKTRLLQALKSCGVGTHIMMPIRYSGEQEWEIGENSYIGENAFIRADGGLIIGSNTVISRNFVLYTINHDWKSGSLPYSSGHIQKPVFIGCNVWIGMNVMVCPGARIHDGAIIGMGSVISGEVPPRAIVGGAKWRILGERNEEEYQAAVKEHRFTTPFGKPWKGGKAQPLEDPSVA